MLTNKIEEINKQFADMINILTNIKNQQVKFLIDYYYSQVENKEFKTITHDLEYFKNKVFDIENNYKINKVEENLNNDDVLGKYKNIICKNFEEFKFKFSNFNNIYNIHENFNLTFIAQLEAKFKQSNELRTNTSNPEQMAKDVDDKIAINANIKDEKRSHILMKMKYYNTILIWDQTKQLTRKVSDFFDNGEFKTNYQVYCGNIFLNCMNRLFIITGREFNMVYFYDPETNEVYRLPSLKYNHCRGGMIYVEKLNSIVCISGRYNNKVEILNLNNLVWPGEAYESQNKDLNDNVQIIENSSVDSLITNENDFMTPTRLSNNNLSRDRVSQEKAMSARKKLENNNYSVRDVSNKTDNNKEFKSFKSSQNISVDNESFKEKPLNRGLTSNIVYGKSGGGGGKSNAGLPELDQRSKPITNTDLSNDDKPYDGAKLDRFNTSTKLNKSESIFDDIPSIDFKNNNLTKKQSSNTVRSYWGMNKKESTNTLERGGASDENRQSISAIPNQPASNENSTINKFFSKPKQRIIINYCKDPNLAWKELPELNFQRNHTSFYATHKYLYVFFGYNSQKGNLNSIERLNLDKLDSWEVVKYQNPKNLNVALDSHGTVYANSDEIFILGGAINNKYSDKIFKYNLHDDAIYLTEMSIPGLVENEYFRFWEESTFKALSNIGIFLNKDEDFLFGSFDAKDKVHFFNSKSFKYNII
jgi:hypothetical protein